VCHMHGDHATLKLEARLEPATDKRAMQCNHVCNVRTRTREYPVATWAATCTRQCVVRREAPRPREGLLLLTAPQPFALATESRGARYQHSLQVRVCVEVQVEVVRVSR
jgi:hypothetical protein